MYTLLLYCYFKWLNQSDFTRTIFLRHLLRCNTVLLFLLLAIISYPAFFLMVKNEDNKENLYLLLINVNEATTRSILSKILTYLV